MWRVGVLVVLLVVAGCGGGDPGEPVQPAPRKEERPGPTAEKDPAPTGLAKEHPVVIVRRGAEVDVYDRPGGEVIETVGDRTQWGSRTVFSVEDAEHGWVGMPVPFAPNGQLAWARRDDPALRDASVAWEIRVDLSDFEAELMVNGNVVRRFPVAIGQPGAETPTGRFAVTDTFRGGLNQAYGCCALALTARQPKLPSGWLGGNRIAIHGTYGPVGGAISHGCVRAANDDVSELVDLVPPGTPVEIVA